MRPMDNEDNLMKMNEWWCASNWKFFSPPTMIWLITIDFIEMLLVTLVVVAPLVGPFPQAIDWLGKFVGGPHLLI